MRIVGHSRTQRTGFEFEPANKANANVAGGAVPLQNHQFQKVAFQVRYNSAVLIARRFDPLPCDDLVGHDFDDTDSRGPIREYFEIPGGTVAHVHGAAWWRHRRGGRG